jgi:hypothetical protein
MEYFGPHNNYQAAGPSRSTAETKPEKSSLWENTAVCICPNCLEKFPKKSGQACVDCRCPLCNVPLRNN